MQFDFEIQAELGQVGEKKVQLVSWAGRPAKIDIRPWRQAEDGLKPGKGITLSEAEAKTLIGILSELIYA